VNKESNKEINSMDENKSNTNYMIVAEQLYFYKNPTTKMNVPNSAYITTEKWYNEWLREKTELKLFDWVIINKQ
jgi:hypothetical protein